MSINTPDEKSYAYVISHFNDRHEHVAIVHPPSLGPAITISHQAGSGTHEIAERLAQILQKSEYKGTRPWTVYDQQLIEQALEENRWPKELAGKITEEKRLFIDELMDDLFGLRPPSWVFVPQVVETMLRLAMAGHAILVGHGATVATAKMSNVFHVRLTSSLTRRIERVQKLRNLTPEAAAKFVGKEDRGRARFVKAHFHARLDNELLYDLAVNTDRVSIDDAVAVIVEGARRFFSVL
jgi:cytidylate kinase